MEDIFQPRKVTEREIKFAERKEKLKKKFAELKEDNITLTFDSGENKNIRKMQIPKDIICWIRILIWRILQRKYELYIKPLLLI